MLLSCFFRKVYARGLPPELSLTVTIPFPELRLPAISKEPNTKIITDVTMLYLLLFMAVLDRISYNGLLSALLNRLERFSA